MTALSAPATPDIRDAFFDELVALARQDSRVIVLSDDQGAMTLSTLKAERPDQYINIGIAEQNLIDVAAGLALSGMRPFVYGITNFVSLRCCEQLSVCASFMALPIAVIASGGGLTYASDGPTHHATQDIAVLRTMPGMTILNPADAPSSAAAARIAYSISGPSYTRIEKGVLASLYGVDETFAAGFGVLREGRDVAIVSSGYLVHEAVRAASLLEARGIQAGVIDLYRLKPIDARALAAALSGSRHIAVMEEQSPIGGVASIIADVIVDHGLSTALRRFSLPDRPLYLYGPREWLHAQTGLDATSVCRSISEWVHGS